MKILIVSDTLVSGGAEWFSLRLWQALRSKDHELSFYVLRPDMVEQRITNNFPGFTYHSLPVWLGLLLLHTDRVINKVLGRPLLLDWFNSRAIRKLIGSFHPEVIHSHLLNTDEIVMRANAQAGVCHIATVHGDYIQFIKTGNMEKIVKASELFRNLDGFILISDEQAAILKQKYPSVIPKTTKVYNGYPVPSNINERVPQATPGRPFTYGLIARGIKEKGWEPAIQAFLQLPYNNIELHLYGESEYLQDLKKQYVGSSRVDLQACKLEYSIVSPK